MLERDVLKNIRLSVGKRPDVVLWHNSTGNAEVVTPTAHGPRRSRIRFGLIEGSSDLVGLCAPYGRFLALEVKSENGIVGEKQDHFLALVNKLGGLGRVVRSEEEAHIAIDEASGFQGQGLSTEDQLRAENAILRDRVSRLKAEVNNIYSIIRSKPEDTRR